MIKNDKVLLQTEKYLDGILYTVEAVVSYDDYKNEGDKLSGSIRVWADNGDLNGEVILSTLPEDHQYIIADGLADSFIRHRKTQRLILAIKVGALVLSLSLLIWFIRAWV